MATYDQYARSDSAELSFGAGSLARGVDWTGEGINILIVGVVFIAIILILPSLFKSGTTAEIEPESEPLVTETEPLTTW